VTTRKRTLARMSAREADKLLRNLEKLASLAPGGTPGHPILVTSPSEVETEARGKACPVCSGELRVEEHVAETIGGARLRIARVVCVACGRRRSIYFQLRGTLLS
jgi:hypothetical protein